MSDETGIIIFGLLFVLWRLDRLGKQLEAVCTNIKAELAPTEERRNEIIHEWKESVRWQNKDSRQAFWGVVILVIVALMAWWFIRHQ